MRILLLLFFSLSSIHVIANDPIAVIPFTIESEHMYFEMKVNDSKTLHFIFDTGASSTVLSESTANDLNIKATGTQIAQGASGSSSLKVANGHQIEFGGLKLGNISFYILNLDHLKRTGVALDGIIGANILYVYNVEFDYDEGVMNIYNRDDFEAPAGWQTESFIMDQFGIPIIEATLSLPDGEELTGKYLVDTGAGTTLKLNTPFVTENKLVEVLGAKSTYQTRSLNTTVTDIITTIPSYEVFGHTFSGFPARLSQVNAGVSGLKGFNGILGHTILKRFNAIYDYDKKLIYLKPNKLYSSSF